MSKARKVFDAVVLLIFSISLAIRFVPWGKLFGTLDFFQSEKFQHFWGSLQRSLAKRFSLGGGSSGATAHALGHWLSIAILALQIGVVLWIVVGPIIMILSKRVLHPRRVDQTEGVGLEIVVPKGVDADRTKMIGVLRVLRASIPKGAWFALEVICWQGKVHFGVWCPRKQAGTIRDRLRGSFPKARFVQRDTLQAALATLEKGEAIVWHELELMNAPHYPLRQDREFEGEPLDSLLGAIEPNSDGVALTAVSFVCRPAAREWKQAGRALIRGMQAPTTDANGRPRPRTLDKWQRDQIDAMKRKLSSDGFELSVRIIAAGPNRPGCGAEAWSITRAMAEYSSDEGGSRQGFTMKRSGMFVVGEENPFAVVPPADSSDELPARVAEPSEAETTPANEPTHGAEADEESFEPWASVAE